MYLEVVASADEVGSLTIEYQRIVFILSIDHAFKSISEHRQVFEWIVHFRNSFKRYEEATDQQERNDQYRHQSHHHSSIRKDS